MPCNLLVACAQVLGIITWTIGRWGVIILFSARKLSNAIHASIFTGKYTDVCNLKKYIDKWVKGKKEMDKYMVNDYSKMLVLGDDRLVLDLENCSNFPC